MGQFAISIALIICTGVVFNQVEYIRAKNMGLNTDQLVAVPLTFVPVMETSPVFKARIMESPYVVKATLSYMLPGHKNAVIPLAVSRPGRQLRIEIRYARGVGPTRTTSTSLGSNWSRAGISTARFPVTGRARARWS